MIIAVALGLLGTGTFAYFSDIEISEENTLTVAIIDLYVNGANTWSGILVNNLDDVKPCEVRWESTTLNNPSNGEIMDVWMKIFNVVTDQGISSEAEEDEEAGIPKCDIDNYIIFDLKVNNQYLIEESEGLYISDIEDFYIYLGEIQPGETIEVEKSYHIEGSVTNWAQGDKMTFSIEFFAQQNQGSAPTPKPELAGHEK